MRARRARHRPRTLRVARRSVRGARGLASLDQRLGVEECEDTGDVTGVDLRRRSKLANAGGATEVDEGSNESTGFGSAKGSSRPLFSVGVFRRALHFDEQTRIRKREPHVAGEVYEANGLLLELLPYRGGQEARHYDGHRRGVPKP